MLLMHGLSYGPALTRNTKERASVCQSDQVGPQATSCNLPFNPDPNHLQLRMSFIPNCRAEYHKSLDLLAARRPAPFYLLGRYLLTAYYIFCSVMPNKWRIHQIRLHGRRGKGTAVFFSRKKNKACTAEGKWMRNSMCPSVRPRLVQVVHPTNLTSRINGKKTQKNTKTQVAPVVQLITSKPSEVGT